MLLRSSPIGILLVFRRQNRREVIFDIELELRGDPRQVDAEGAPHLAERTVKRPACPMPVVARVQRHVAAVHANPLQKFAAGSSHGPQVGCEFRSSVQLAQFAAEKPPYVHH